MSSFFGSDSPPANAYVPPQAPQAPANPLVLGANAPTKGKQQPKSQQATFLAGGDIPQAQNRGNKTLLGQA